MDKTFSSDERIQALRQLPPQVQELILSEEIGDRYDNLQKRYGLRSDETKVLAEETNALMVGLVKPNEFSERLHERLPSMDAQKVDTIVSGVNQQILKPIREALREMHSELSTSEERPQGENLTPVYGQVSEGPEIQGIERSMPRDVEEAKRREQAGLQKQETKEGGPEKQTSEKPVSPIPAEQKEFFSKNTYDSGDPYREPIE